MADAFSMLSPVLVGFFLGKYLDGLFNIFPLLTLTLTLLGVATGIYSMIKNAYKNNK